MSALTARQQSFIVMMKANNDLARKGFKLLLQRNDYPRFFDVLDDAGFFLPITNPGPVPGERENTVWIPFWAPLDYLKAVATHAGAENEMALATKVMNVVRAISAWRDEKGEPRHNYHTNRIFAEILGLVPTNAVTLGDIELLREWFSDPFDNMLVVGALDKGALSCFLGSTNPEDWKKAAQVLYQLTAITWRKGGDEREPTPSSVVDDFWLGEILKHHAREIGRKAGRDATEVMAGRVREVFSTPMRRDYSTLFRPAIEDDAQNYQWRSVENRVIEGLRDVLLGWSDEDPDSAREVIETMIGEGLQIIRRVGVYIVAQNWMNMNDLYAEVVVPGLFTRHSHEVYHLLQDHFAEMSPVQQAATVKAIETLPNSGHGDDPELLRRHSQYRWLSAISGKGYAPAYRLFAELDADPKIGKLGDHPDFDSYITTGWVGPGPTPYTPEELVALIQANDLVNKLNSFAPANDWRGPTTDGLTSALENAARTNPDIFLAELTQFLSAKPIYQHAVINGLRGAWDAKTDANWERGWGQIVSLFEQLTNDEHFWQQRDDDQRRVVTVIADSLHAGTKEDEHAYDPSLLSRTQTIIACLLQHEPGIETAADDAMTQALNTAKGRIIEALYSQALRAARVSDQQHGTHSETWKAISPVFDIELAKCTNANYEFSTLMGTYLPQLQYLDGTWTSERVDQIFPIQYEVNTICALDGLAYAAFTKPLYELLVANGVIDRALALELKGRSAREKLVERIGAAYIWGLEHIDGPHFAKLFNTTTIEDLQVLISVFWMVRAEKLTSEQGERIFRFWGRILDWAQHQAQVPARLLSRLSLLATYVTTVGPDEQRMLEAVAPYVHVGHEAYEFIAELHRLAPQDPEAITKILQTMIAAHAPEYDYQDRLRSLLEFLATHGQREAIILISDRLRHLQGIETLFKSLTQH
jgi:hypothetical protein